MKGESSVKQEAGKPTTNSPGWAQVILGFILALIALLGLTVGIARIWIWFNVNYAHRQTAYQRSRIFAGRPYNYTDAAPESYIDISGADTSRYPEQKYRPLDLTDNWVFRGTPSGTVQQPLGGAEGQFTYMQMLLMCMNQCLGQPGCGATTAGFNTQCPCFVKCACLALIQLEVTSLIQQAQALRNQADMLDRNAQSMDDRADQCDEPWEICWWFGWGKTADKLREAARKLRDVATQLRYEAAKMDKTRTEMIACCDEATTELQQACMNKITVASCAELVNMFTLAWQQALLLTRQQIRDAQQEIIAINNYVADCQINYGYTYTDPEACCRAYRNYGRNCYDPTTDCDGDCLNPSSSCYCNPTISTCPQPPRCGLAEIARRIQIKIDTELIPRVNSLVDAINRIQGCCSYPTPQEQWNCILSINPG